MTTKTKKKSAATERVTKEYHEQEGVRIDLVDATEANLGGTYADPSAIRGRTLPVDGFRRWSMAGVLREVAYAKALTTDPAALRARAPWESLGGTPAPALRRFMVKTPEMARALPAPFTARPGTRYVVGEVDEGHRPRAPTPVALDRLGYVAEWQRLNWVDLLTGRPLTVTTDLAAVVVVLAAPNSVLVATLDEKTTAWSAPSPAEPAECVVIDPRLIRRVGRVSGMLDAYNEGRPGTLTSYTPKYRKCECGCGHPVRRTHGARYKDETHRQAATRDKRRPDVPAKRCACGCGQAISSGRRDRRYISDAHRKRLRPPRPRRVTAISTHSTTVSRMKG